MKALIGVLWFIVLVFLNPIESMMNTWNKHTPPPGPQIAHAKFDIHPVLSARNYLSSFRTKEGAVQRLHQGPVEVGILKENNVDYVIGYIEEIVRGRKTLCPFVHPILNRMVWENTRIKIRVDGLYAYRYVIIPKGDILEDFFYKEYDTERIRTFQIVEFGARHLEQEIKPQVTHAMSHNYIKLSARAYISSNVQHEQKVRGLRQGLVKVGIQEENRVVYVIGYIQEIEGLKPELVPFIHAIPELQMDFRRIKIRVDGDYAYRYVVIPEGDALDDLFYKEYDKNHIRTYEFEGLRARLLEPETKPAALGKISSSQASTSAGQAGYRQSSPQRTEPQLARLISLAPPPATDNNAKANALLPITDLASWASHLSYRKVPEN